MIARFPRLFQKPVAAMLYQRMFRAAHSVETCRQIAAQLQTPQGTVSHLPSTPAFLFRSPNPLFDNKDVPRYYGMPWEPGPS